MPETYEHLEKRCNKATSEVARLRQLLEDVVNVLDLSDHAIEKHGPLGTPPAEMVREVLAEKDAVIACLRAGMKGVR